MPIVYNPASPYNIETSAWDRPKRQGGHREDDPAKMEYPKMLYRAQHFKGKRMCFAQEPYPWEFNTLDEYGRAKAQVEQFNKANMLTVGDQYEEQRAKESGWREGPKEAVTYLELKDDGRDTAAAHRAYEDRNMSDAARSEIAAAEASSDFNVPEVPVKRRGRPRKVVSKIIAEA